jgi:hypothetical protein
MITLFHDDSLGTECSLHGDIYMANVATLHSMRLVVLSTTLEYPIYHSFSRKHLPEDGHVDLIIIFYKLNFPGYKAQVDCQTSNQANP